MKSFVSGRASHSAGVEGGVSFPMSPYHRPLTTSNTIDKSSVLWKDFTAGVHKRKLLIRKLQLAATETSTPLSVIKKALLDLRMATLTVIEDALEIEYRAKIDTAKGVKGSLKNARLPPITSFRAIEEKEDIYSLVDMLCDVDDLFHVPNVRVMLPVNFPETRNPFMLGKSIDEMATIVPPHPQPGNAEEELKVLELLRYKRASRALLRAESQVGNRLPVELYDVEKLLTKMTDDFNVEKMLRCVCTILDNENAEFASEPVMTCLTRPIFNLEAHEFLNRLNAFKGIRPIRIDVQIAMRQTLRDLVLDYLDDPVSRYLIDWLEVVLGSSKPSDAPTTLAPVVDVTRGLSASQSRLGKPSLGTISEHDFPSHSEVVYPLPQLHQHSRTGSRAFGGHPIPPITRGDSNLSDVSDGDLVSEVGSKGKVYTHEDIFVENRPQTKMQKRTPDMIASPPRLPLREALGQRLNTASSSKQSAGRHPPAHPTSVAVEDDDFDEVMGSQRSLGHQPNQEEKNSHQAGSSDEPPLPKKPRKKIGQKLDIPEERPVGNAPALLRKKIRAEVERAMNEVGLGVGKSGSGGDEHGMSGGNMDILSSVRYELNKMQQELLRRRVLDPRHYAITSVDAISHASKGLTVADINSFGLGGKKRRAGGTGEGLEDARENAVMGPVTILEKTLDVPTKLGELRLYLSMVLDMASMTLFANIASSREDAYRHNIIDELPLGSDNKHIFMDIASTKISRLIFSRVTNHTMQELISATADVKKRMLQNVCETVDTMIHDAVVPVGNMVFQADRGLFTKKYAEDNVLIDLLISRNDDCSGVVIRVTPLAGLFHKEVGPVVLHVSDHELEVLLISQHSLFEKGMDKWASMSIVAQWLAGRVLIKKIAASNQPPLLNASTMRPLTSTGRGLPLLMGRESTTIHEEDEASVNSQLTLSARGNNKDDDLSVNTDQLVANPHALLLLDVKIDTHIELAKALVDSWRAAHVPKLIGLDVKVRAWQDLEVMAIAIDLAVPSRKTYRRLVSDIKRNTYDDDDDDNDSQSRNEGGGGGLMDMDNYSDDGNYEYDSGQPTPISFEYRLTRAELLTFGAIPMIDNKRASLTKNKTVQHVDDHPENMLWNIFNRMKIHFAGSSADPYKSATSASDPANWSITYERQILRDVKTVSNTAVMLAVSVYGSELMIEAQRVESKHSSQIGSKRVSEEELQSFVYEEGYMLSFLEYQRRKDLAGHLINHLKLVDDVDHPQRIELYTFIESRMLTISRMATHEDPEEELGAVEINNHHTLSDLRILMKHELEIEQLPTMFRFLYKGAECSLRQETFRRAWECLPNCMIVAKVIQSKETGTETDDIAQKRLMQKPKKLTADASIPRIPKGQRRVLGKFAPIPLPTLVTVTEGRSQVFLLHQGTDLMLNPGDIVRVGHVSGRDYIVMSVGFQGEHDTLNMQMIEIDPVYDLIGEPDFNLPIQSNFAWPTKHAGTVMQDYVKRVRILKRPADLGYTYNWTGEKTGAKTTGIVREYENKKPMGKNTFNASLNTMSTSMVIVEQSTLVNPSVVTTASTTNFLEKSANNNNLTLPLLSTGGTQQGGALLENSLLMTQQSNNGGDDNASVYSLQSNASDGSGARKTNGRKKKMKVKVRKFTDCWIWKCIPAAEDTRLKWRQLYDDGEVHYQYEFGQSEEFLTHFRVKAWYSYLEVLCTDSRVPTFTLHHQRVHEMPSFDLDYYTKLAFDRITDWSPAYKKGIERMKFLKLMKDTKAFPDLKRPARVAQLDMYFQKVVKSDYGIVQKYITYKGFCYLLKIVSLLRFPQRRKAKDKEEGDEEKSLEGDPAKKTHDNDNNSLMTDDMSIGSLGSDSDSSITTKQQKAGGAKGQSKTQNGKVHGGSPSKSGKSRSSHPKAKGKHSSNDDESAAAASPVPVVDPEHAIFAYQKFILDYVMMVPGWYDQPWRDAKLMAMRKEAVRYCAATRIAAMFRGHFQRQRYLFFLRQHTKLQANIRRKLSARRTQDLVSLLEEDWYFRQRYYYATMITKIVRRFLKRCWYERMIDAIRRQQVLLMKARRQKLKKAKDSSRRTRIYTEAKRINGVMVIIYVYRKDPRNYTKDFGLILQIYVPVSQQTVTFHLEDVELRSYMCVALEVDVVNNGQLLDKRNLKLLIGQRLIVHKAGTKKAGVHAHPIITFSKHALGQRGEKTMTCARRIMKEMFVCKIFETVEDIAVQLYHRHTCKIFTATMAMHELRAWIREEHIITARANDNELLQNMDPIELHPKHKLELYDWVLKHLVIDTRHGTFKVIWSNQYEKSRKREMVIKIQSVWRRALVRPPIVRRLDTFMLKVQISAYDHTCYYLNLLNGVTQWERPRLLGSYDLPTQPTRRWVAVNYPDSPVQYYVNPYTGKYTYLVPHRAACIIQSLVRNLLLKTISMPMADFIQAGKIFQQAEKQYHAAAGQRKLAPVINYALVKHLIELDEPPAKDIYREAVDLSESNPLVTRAYAFYLLATCEAPIALNRDRALLLLLDAKRKDPEHLKFATAYHLFQFACLRAPHDFRTLLNLAMVQCLLYDLNFTAEKLLRRALSIAPFEERVIEVWKFLRDRFPERQLVYNPLSRVHQINQSKGSVPLNKRKILHGRPVLENVHWAGWTYVEEDTYKVSKQFRNQPYWYNPADGTESEDMPDFAEQWIIRRQRSQWIGDQHGLDEYYDPLTAEYFQHHVLTDTYN